MRFASTSTVRVDDPAELGDFGVIGRFLGALDLLDSQCLRSAIIPQLQPQRFGAIIGGWLTLLGRALFEQVREDFTRNFSLEMGTKAVGVIVPEIPHLSVLVLSGTASASSNLEQIHQSPAFAESGGE